MIHGKIHHNAGHFLMYLEPHAAMVAKKIFTRLKDRNAAPGVLTLKASPETAADLEMLLFRFKHQFEMDGQTKATIAKLSTEHHDRVSNLEAIMSTAYQANVNDDLVLPLRGYQRIGRDWMRRAGFGILGDDIGLGKTAQAIGAMATGEHLPAAVVTLTHLTKQWQRELQKFAPHLRSHIISTGKLYPLPTITLNGKECGPDVVILNYGVKLSNWGEVLGRYCKIAFFDECQELRRAEKEPGVFTDKYAGAVSLSMGTGRAIGMSASPIYNYGGEIFNVYDALRPGCLGEWSEFAAEHCTNYDRSRASLKDPDGFGGYLRNNFLMLRRTRKDVGRELGPCQRITVPVDADKAQLDKIEGRAGELARIILGTVKGGKGEARNASAEIENIVRQATGVAKAPQVAAFVKGLMDQGEKVVLFGWHRAVYDIWLEQLKEYNPVMYTGSESPGQKEAARDRFIRGESKLMIVSLRSGIGLDGLQYVANTCVFGELDWSPEVHKQCIGRVHRDGREAGSTVMAYFLVSDSGLDPIMSEVLGLKDEQSTWLMDGAPTAITQRVDDKIIKRVAEKYAKGVT
jgi:hypothetical protein